MKTVKLYWKWLIVGEVDHDTFELVKMDLAAGKETVAIVQALIKKGFERMHSVVIVQEAKKHLLI